MVYRIKVGQSRVNSSEASGVEAGKELVQKAVEDGDMDDVGFGFLYCSVAFDVKKLVAGVEEELESFGADFAGCTTSGEISREGPSKESVVLMLIDDDERLDFYTSMSRNIFDDPESSGQEVTSIIEEENDFYGQRNQLLYLISPGPTVEHLNADHHVLKGVQKELNQQLPIVGAAAGDDYNMRSTKQILNGKILEQGLVAIGISTDLEIFTGQETGLEKQIATGIASETDGRVIKEISGKPAKEFYAENIGIDPEDLDESYSMSWKKKLKLVPKAVKKLIRDGEIVNVTSIYKYALENPIADELRPGELRLSTPYRTTNEGGIKTIVEIPENRTVHIMEGEIDEIKKAGAKAFSDVNSEKTVFSVVSDCSCRNQLMEREHLDEEVKLMKEQLNCPMIGLYGMGEIGGEDGEICTFKNQTVSGFALVEPE